MLSPYFGELFNLSPLTLLIVLAILLLLFGGKKLPELARSLGSSAKELRKGLNDDAETEKSTPKSDVEPKQS